jgi:hypothetical protein
MTYLHRFTKKCHLLSVTARLVLMLLVGMLGITTPCCTRPGKRG